MFSCIFFTLFGGLDFIFLSFVILSMMAFFELIVVFLL